MSVRMTALGCVSLLACIVACSTSSSGTSSPKPSSSTDDTASTDDSGSAVLDSGKSPKDSGVAEVTCEGDCLKTQVAATFGSNFAVFQQAYFGFDLSGTLRVEVHGGTPNGCPTSSSAYDWSLVIANLEPSALKAKKAATLTATLFDYKGNLLTTPAEKASKATLTPRVVDGESPRGFVEGDVSTTFGGGEVVGHVYATHCDSLDET